MQALIDMVAEATSNSQQSHAPAASALYTLGSMCKFVDCSRQLCTAAFAALLATCATSDNRELRQRAERVQVSCWQSSKWLALPMAGKWLKVACCLPATKHSVCTHAVPIKAKQLLDWSMPQHAVQVETTHSIKKYESWLYAESDNPMAGCVMTLVCHGNGILYLAHVSAVEVAGPCALLSMAALDVGQDRCQALRVGSTANMQLCSKQLRHAVCC